MTWKRLVVLVAAALCTTCGGVTVHGGDTHAGANAFDYASAPESSAAIPRARSL